MRLAEKTELLTVISLVIYILLASVRIAAAVASIAPNQPSWFEHMDLMQVIIAGLFLIVLWFITRTIRKVDSNQTKLFERLDTLSKDFYQLQGEHNVMLCKKNRHREIENNGIDHRH